MGRLTIVVALVAVLVGYLIGTSPAGVTPPTTPPGSPTACPAVAHISIRHRHERVLRGGASGHCPPVQVVNLATAYWQSEISYSLTTAVPSTRSG